MEEQVTVDSLLCTNSSSLGEGNKRGLLCGEMGEIVQRNSLTMWKCDLCVAAKVSEA